MCLRKQTESWCQGQYSSPRSRSNPFRRSTSLFLRFFRYMSRCPLCTYNIVDSTILRLEEKWTLKSSWVVIFWVVSSHVHPNKPHWLHSIPSWYSTVSPPPLHTLLEHLKTVGRARFKGGQTVTIYRSIKLWALLKVLWRLRVISYYPSLRVTIFTLATVFCFSLIGNLSNNDGYENVT